MGRRMSDSTVTRLRALLEESAEARWEPAFSQEYESIEDVIAWAAESFIQRPDHTYLGVVQSEIPAADGGAGLLAITGNGPHSLAHAVLIAEALNALPALLDVAEAAQEYAAGMGSAPLYRALAALIAAERPSLVDTDPGDEQR